MFNGFELSDENKLPWENYPHGVGSSVLVDGRSEAGDVAALSGVEALVVGCYFAEGLGNFYSVRVDGKQYDGISPDMLSSLAPCAPVSDGVVES